MAYWMLDAKGDPTMAHERCAKVTWSGAAPTAGDVCAALAPFGVHLAAARDALAAFAARAHAVLLFSSSVDEIVVGVASEARTETETDTKTKTEEKQTRSVDVLGDARAVGGMEARADASRSGATIKLKVCLHS